MMVELVVVVMVVMEPANFIVGKCRYCGRQEGGISHYTDT